VTLRVSHRHDFVAFRVLSNGNAIQPSEKLRIFDRFYRGVGGRRMAPGSGLGLFVSRKIALAHGGSLELDTEDSSADGTAFCLMLPIPENERGRERHDIAAAL